MTTMHELQDQINRLLTPAVIGRYDGIMSRVADARDSFAALGKLVHRRPGAQFRVSTGRARRSKTGLEIDVRVAGTSVGTLHINGKDSRVFEPHPKNFRTLRDWHAAVPWLDERVASYIKQVYESSKAETRPEFRREARVEAAFVDAFDAREPWTKNLALERIGRLPYQVPVPVGGSAKAKKTEGGLGFIDGLARSGRGHGLRVFELKKPTATAQEAASSVRQAATYALTLKLLIDEHKTVGYRRMFNAEGKVRDRHRFVVTPFVPVNTRAAVQEACRRLMKDPVDGVEVKPLYFEWDRERSRLTVSE